MIISDSESLEEDDTLLDPAPVANPVETNTKTRSWVYLHAEKVETSNGKMLQNFGTAKVKFIWK
jgi:hypothetical protein